MRKQLTTILLLGILVFLVSCGNGSEKASISRIALGKNLTADPAITSFDIKDVIYAVAAVSNAKGKHSIRFTVTEENVEGRAQGNAVMNKSIDFEVEKPLSLQFLVAYPGEYKVTVTLFDAADNQIDNRSEMMTVTGEPEPLEVEHEGGIDEDEGRDSAKDGKHKKDRDSQHDKVDSKDRK